MPCDGDPIECGWEAAMGDLEMRLERADKELNHLQLSVSRREDVARLKSKAEGVRLALSYVKEYHR